MKRKKRSALFSAAISLLLCVAMLAGTTFAWFTDTVTSSINRIAAGNLDIELEYLSDGKWKSVQDSTNVFNKDALWEPGHTEVVYLRISNAGELALKYQLGVHITKETGSINAKGNPFVLSDYIEFSAIKDVKTPYASREDARKAVTSSSILSAGYNQQDSILPGGEPHYVALVVYMPESVGNDANHATGVEAPHIELGIHLFATQQTHESDSFGNSYDSAVEFPLNNVNVTVAAPIHNNAENGVIASAMSVGNTGSGITAKIPQGVALDDGASALTLSVKSLETSEANIALQQGESKTSLDIHIDGVAADNTVPMLITLDGYFPTGLNSTSLALYHVENGVTLQMTPVTNPTNHNEFRYDPATGTVVLCVASFSEYVAVTDDFNRWEGTLDISWYNDTATEFTLTTAEQLAGFGAIVDGGYKKSDGTWVDIPADTFEGKTVRLGADINLGGRLSFNPIGYGYDYDGYMKDGRTFNGTFDGQGHTIVGLYQNGWEIGLSYCMAGGGLFASVVDATIRNVKIVNANIVMECVDMGILVGYSQGTCTYENIEINYSKIANYQRATGGVVGEVSPRYDDNKNVISSKHTFRNVVVNNSVTVGSLWGDFDAPCGGIIGAKWDDTDSTSVIMDNVRVACKMDVYNDVTSTYQWYAYRRSGMLIGNTEETGARDGGGTVASTLDSTGKSFLTCTNVTVYYGPWVEYHYCEFNNHNSSWPWVRVEEGENCSAFSNPRYGVPNDPDTGRPVTGFPHNHSGDDECNVPLAFNQLYGGGQGVYGQSTHDGVDIIDYKYTITYANDTKILDIIYVTNEMGSIKTANEKAQKLVMEWAADNISGEVVFGGWMNAGSTKLTEIPATNDKDIVLYPYFNKPYTASFVDQEGNVLAWCFFNNQDISKLEATKTAATALLPNPGKDFELQWQVNGETFEASNFKKYTKDVTVYPVYVYTGNLKLTPIDNAPADGIIDYYRVDATTGLSGAVDVPGSVNGVPVLVVQDLCYGESITNLNTKLTKITFNEGTERIESKAIAYTTALTEVVLPRTLKYIGANAFASSLGSVGGIFDAKQVITFTYNGTCAEWEALDRASHEKWDYDLVKGSSVVCTDGYYVLEKTTYLGYGSTEWAKHAHEYGTNCVTGCP